MGVNMAGYCITDDAVCQAAARQEIIRRYLKAVVDRRNEKVDDAVVDKIDSLLKANDISLSERKCIAAAKEKALKTGVPAAAIELTMARSSPAKPRRF
jgi:uncharacterized protein (UPF0371 family)